MQRQHMFALYQVRDCAETRNMMFESIRYLRSKHIPIAMSNYDLVYEGPLVPQDTMEGLYVTFNVNHPPDYRGRSMSVSDVLVMEQNDIKKAYYVDSFGFVDVTAEFFNINNNK